MNPDLVQALQQEFQLSAKDIADIFWLASHIDQYSESVTPPEETSASSSAEPSSDSSSSSQPPREPGTQTPTPEDSATTPHENLPENQPPAPVSPATPQPPQAEIVPKPEPSQTAAGGGGLPIRLADAPSLREPLTLARALKPLMRRVSGGRDWVIDEVATSEQIASQGIWLPVLRPRLEPWLDLDLVIEDCLSMLLWRHTLRDLEKLLKNYGIFRDVRVWSLLTDNPEAVKIRRGIGATAKHQAPRSPKELIDPTGRRLVIVVSDCVSKVWREGKMTPILDLWAKRGSMAILQMLPEWMWKRSGLGWEALVRLQGLNPGDWNQNLKVDEFPLWWDEEVTHQVVKVPIFTLEPESVGSWARLVAGKGNVWAAGYLFKYVEHQRRRKRPNSGGELTAEKRVNGFRATASRVARKLAGLLAAAPVITLPVVRLIQATLLKESLPVNVAEVFLGGLLKPISEIDIDTDPELVQYDFMPGVRELLLESVPVDETVRVIDEVSRRVAKNLGFAVEDFGAILRNPQQLGEGDVQENAIAFARVTAQILRSLGGAYVEYAEQLESPSVVEEPQPEEPEPEESQPTALAQFWQQLLQAEMEGGTAAVHQVMRENMGLIVSDLGDVIAQFVQGFLEQNPDQAEEIARLVENTCISIQEFPEGRYAEVLEITIRGYDVLLALGADNPAKRAGTLMNLGNVYRNQAELLGIDPIVNLEKAIAAYDEAAGIRRRLGLDKDLSMTLTNLGNARRTQAEMGMDPGANLQSAIAAYDEAAAIQRHLGLARDLAKTLNNFGLAYQAQSRLAGNSSLQKQQALENAYRNFQGALEQVEYLRGEIGADSEGYKRNFNEEWNKVYLGMLEVCLELGRYQDALEYVDRSKARNLAELMTNRDAYPGGVIPENIRQQLQSLKIAISQENRRLQQEENPDSTRLNQLRQQKQELEPYKPLHFEAMQGLLDEETAILEWYILPDKFLTFTLTAESLNLWTSSQEDRNNLINWTNTYLSDYRNRDNNQWGDTLAEDLETLSQILHLDEILSNLRQNFPNCNKLIFIPHRHLHLLPLHALPTSLPFCPPVRSGASSGDEYSGDEYVFLRSGFLTAGECKFLQDLFPKGIAYAPNCQILQQAQSRPRPHFNRLLAIENPTGDLNWSEIEVESIGTLFPQRETLRGKNASLANFLNNNLSQVDHLFFSGHGSFNLNSPLDSGLLFADGVLTLEQIINQLNLSNCRLVTLSASETGQVALDETDEYIGLPSGFLVAGATNVVCSLWSPNEVSTAILMIRFYETLHQQFNSSVAMALQQSQQWLREVTVQHLLNWTDNCPLISDYWRDNMKEALTAFFGKNGLDAKPFESPFYWAAFVAIAGPSG
ncbi:SAV_2336 N-terminal domain-related protein [Limnospira platensis CENA597]|uniref:SAV_2336 N-terminal domain-related protein n=1 Tax=Limnospira platensis TaxID=118562 RepID=UPI003DA093BF